MLYLRILKTKGGLCPTNTFDGYVELVVLILIKIARVLVYDLQNRGIVYNCVDLEASCRRLMTKIHLQKQELMQ